MRGLMTSTGLTYAISWSAGRVSALASAGCEGATEEQEKHC